MEINGVEYAFGGNALSEYCGIYEMTPREHEVFEYKNSFEVGTVHDQITISNALNALMDKY